MSFKVIFDGFDTKEQANAFVNWYEGQGESDSQVWLEEHSDLNGAYAYDTKEVDEDLIIILDLDYK